VKAVLVLGGLVFDELHAVCGVTEAARPGRRQAALDALAYLPGSRTASAMPSTRMTRRAKSSPARVPSRYWLILRRSAPESLILASGRAWVLRRRTSFSRPWSSWRVSLSTRVRSTTTFSIPTLLARLGRGPGVRSDQSRGDELHDLSTASSDSIAKAFSRSNARFTAYVIAHPRAP
jgi:hypothetical protein